MRAISPFLSPTTPIPSLSSLSLISSLSPLSSVGVVSLSVFLCACLLGDGAFPRAAGADVTFRLRNGQTVEAVSFERGVSEVKVTTPDGMRISLPLSNLEDPLKAWAEESTALEQQGRAEEALDRIRMARRWASDPSLVEREAALLSALSRQIEREFLQSYERGETAPCAAALKRLGGLGVPIPPRVVAALEGILRDAETAAAGQDIELANRLYNAYLAIRPDSPEVRRAAEPIATRMKAVELDRRLGEVDRLVEAGRLEEARPLLDSLAAETPSDERVLERGRLVARKLAEPRIAAALPELRQWIDLGRWFESESRVAAFLRDVPGHADLTALLQKIESDRATFLAGIETNFVVACYDDPTQNYSLWVPPGYNPHEPIPILYVSSASGGARGEGFSPSIEATRHLGWMVAHINDSRNGPWDDILRAQAAVTRDTASRFHLNPTRQFATGFSGGSRASFMLAFHNPGRVRGVLGMGAGLPNVAYSIHSSDLVACFLIGTEDSNAQYDIPRGVDILAKVGIRAPVRTYPAGHQMPSVQMMRESFDWIDRNVK